MSVYRKVEVREGTFTPAAVATAETTAVIRVIPGERVIALSVKIATSADVGSNSTIEFGDGDDTDGFMEAVQSRGPLKGTIIDGQGVYLAFSGGKLYQQVDNIDARYLPNQTTTGTAPSWDVRALLVRDW